MAEEENESLTSMSPSASYTQRLRGPGGRVPIRFIVLGMILVATALEYICRYNINVSMVAMVKEPTFSNTSHPHLPGVCPAAKYPANVTQLPDRGTYEWDDRTQGLILGAFFYTYTIMQIPAGRLAEEYGGRWFTVGSLLGSGIVNLLTPFLTYSVTVLFISRMVLGFVQSCLFPSCFSIVYQWLPLEERSMGFSLMELGTNIGSISAAYMAGYLADHGFGGGWPSTFYVSGFMALLGGIIFFPYVTSLPEESNLISVAELEHIRKDSGNRSRKTNHNLKNKLPVPWMQIITCKAVIANVVSKFCLSWTFYTLVMKLPTYLHDVIGMSTTMNGFVNGSMYLCQMGPLLAGGYVSEKIIRHKLLTRTQTRKVFISVASLGSAFCLILVPFASCNESMVISILMAVNVFQGLDSAGNIPLPGEITKNFATTLFAIVNMFNTSIGFIVPYVIGTILDSRKDMDQLYVWSLVFYLAASMSIFGTIVMVTIGSADRQDWDLDPISGDEGSELIPDDDEDIPPPKPYEGDHYSPIAD